MRSASDAMLLLGARRHDEEALAGLYDRYGGLIFTLGLRMVGDRDHAEKIVQDTFLRCWRGHEEYDPTQDSVVGWLCGMARRHALELLRSGRLQMGRPEHALPIEPGAAETATVGADKRERRAIVAQALAALPDRQREAIELAFYDGLTQTEIASRLGEPPDAIKIGIRDGIHELHRLLATAVDAPASGEAGAS